MEAGKMNGAQASGRNAPVAVQLDVPGTLRDHVRRLAGESGLTTCEYFHNSVAMTVIADIHERELADGDAELVLSAEMDQALVEAAVREAVEKLVDLGMLDRVPGEPNTFTAQWGTFEDCRTHENTKLSSSTSAGTSFGRAATRPCPWRSSYREPCWRTLSGWRRFAERRARITSCWRWASRWKPIYQNRPRFALAWRCPICRGTRPIVR